MIDQASHDDIMQELKAFRDEIRPLTEMKPELDELVQSMRAMKLGGKGVKWIASIMTALLTIGGLLIGIKALAMGMWNGDAG